MKIQHILTVATLVATSGLAQAQVDPLHVRVDIDENDAWRFRKGGKAIAFLRGNRNFSTELDLEMTRRGRQD